LHSRYILGETKWGVFNIITKLNSYDRPLKVEDVVDVFGLSKTTVYRLSESGQMPSAMFGGSRIYDPSTLAMWVAGKQPLIAKAARQLEKEKEDAKGKCICSLRS